MLSLSLKQEIENGALLNSFQLDLGLHRETCHRVTGGELGGFYPRPWFAPTKTPTPMPANAGATGWSWLWLHPSCLPCRESQALSAACSRPPSMHALPDGSKVFSLLPHCRILPISPVCSPIDPWEVEAWSILEAWSKGQHWARSQLLSQSLLPSTYHWSTNY